MIINHEIDAYKVKRARTFSSRNNGAYFYSREICENIIPRVKTTRNWITINVKGYGASHAIVFIHNNVNPERYDWLEDYDDLILVCGIPETVDKVKHLGHAVYLPLSIDVEYVKKFRKEKTRDICFAGRRSKKRYGNVPDDIDCLEGLPREELLSRMAEYKAVYAVGRTAIEARVLGCEIVPYDERYPDTSIWRVIDNKEAAAMLQDILDKIDGVSK